MPAERIRIATRRSPLALWQANHVAGRLRAEGAARDVELVPMRTTGDRLLDAPLAKVGGKGLFVKELEQALLDGRADIAVHSMKDVPVELPAGLHLPVVLERADPRDALVAPPGTRLAELPPGARVGTSSLRRKCQIAALRPDVELVDLRGNVQTRLGRLDGGDFQAIVLARAGLARLGLAHREAEVLEVDRVLPAIGQGALGIECRTGDEAVEGAIAGLVHEETAVRVAAERALNARLGGGCQVPVAGHARVAGGRLELRGLVASVDGTRVLTARASGDPASAAAIGEEVALALLGQGAREILDEVYGASPGAR